MIEVGCERRHLQTLRGDRLAAGPPADRFGYIDRRYPTFVRRGQLWISAVSHLCGRRIDIANEGKPHRCQTDAKSHTDQCHNRVPSINLIRFKYASENSRAFPRLNESKFCCHGLGGLIR